MIIVVLRSIRFRSMFDTFISIFISNKFLLHHSKSNQCIESVKCIIEHYSNTFVNESVRTKTRWVVTVLPKFYGHHRSNSLRNNQINQNRLIFDRTKKILGKKSRFFSHNIDLFLNKIQFCSYDTVPI